MRFLATRGRRPRRGLTSPTRRHTTYTTSKAKPARSSNSAAAAASSLNQTTHRSLDVEPPRHPRHHREQRRAGSQGWPNRGLWRAVSATADRHVPDHGEQLQCRSVLVSVQPCPGSNNSSQRYIAGSAGEKRLGARIPLAPMSLLRMSLLRGSTLTGRHETPYQLGPGADVKLSVDT